ncbi:MAG: diaminopimelate epimerase [Planctomycetes bacterium]|nr:diaminopimelate epimerase [Planctomycetota bacterium]MCG2685451.1 diaminopimelate epimerase [Planctomycetales bacterium]
MRLTKMHGAGNDYVFIDCFQQPPPERPDELARKISDRHFGVGGDGLILICPSESADARMRIFNADGSEAEMCGNGVRCVAKYVYDHGLCRHDRLRIETGRGVLDLDLEIAAGKVHRVRVDMGEPILEPARIPVELPRSPDADRMVDFPADEYIPLDGPDGWRDRCGLDPRITCVSMGNPHTVMYCREVASVPLEWLGPGFERLPIFPRRINVHFVQVESPSEVIMRTWERGSGATLACGTGACAVCVAGVLTGRTDRTLLVHLPGGDLELNWADDNHVHLTGEAVEVFHGQWDERSV